MDRFGIAIGKSLPPPPEPASYFVGINVGVIRKSTEIVVGHLDPGLSFVVDSTETVTGIVQDLDYFSNESLLDFIKFSNKPMKARFGEKDSSFIIQALLVHGISYDQIRPTADWRTVLSQKCINLNILFGLVSNGLSHYQSYVSTSKKFQIPYELALSLAAEQIEKTKSFKETPILEYNQKPRPRPGRTGF